MLNYAVVKCESIFSANISIAIRLFDLYVYSITNVLCGYRKTVSGKAYVS